MKLYCMCKITGPGQYEMGPVLDQQVYLAPNRFLPGVPTETDRSPNWEMVITQSMQCLENGVHQRAALIDYTKLVNTHPKTKGQRDKNHAMLRENTKRHYPNVDLYHCKRCGAMICVGV